MKNRICSVVAERIPLELLTRRPLSPLQLAEVQVVLSSTSVAVLAFTFCHLLHWVAFGQTQQDPPSDAATADPNYSSSKHASAGTLASSLPACLETKTPLEPRAQQNVQVKSRQAQGSLPGSSQLLSREDKILHQGEKILTRGIAALTQHEEATAAGIPMQQYPESVVTNTLRRLRSASRISQAFAQRGADDSRHAIGECAGIHVPLKAPEERLKALAIAEATYKQITEKIKVWGC